MTSGIDLDQLTSHDTITLACARLPCHRPPPAGTTELVALRDGSTVLIRQVHSAG